MNPDTACTRFVDVIAARGQPSAELVAHLAACPDCRALADTVRNLRRLPSAYPEGGFGALKAKVIAASVPAAAAAATTAAGTGAGAAGAAGAGILKTAAAVLVPLAVVAGLAFVSLRGPAAPPTPPAVVTAPAALPAAPTAHPASAALHAPVASHPAATAATEPGETTLPTDQE